MGPRYLQAQIHADYSTGSSAWSDYRSQIKSMYDLSNSKEDFNDHLIREYNRKIDRLNKKQILYISPFDAGYRFIGDTINEPYIFDGLIAYWKLDETSGTRYDSYGDYHLSSDRIDSDTGVVGNSAVSNYDGLFPAPNLQIKPSPYDSVGASWSLSFWMSTNDDVSAETNQMFPNAWANCCLFRIRTISGVPTVEGSVWHDPIGMNQPTLTDVSKSGVYGGGFVHVAITHDLPIKTIRVYYDGVEEHMFVYNTTLCGVSPLNGFENDILSMFAGDYYGSNYGGAGKLDEVGIWGRALEASEVSTLYNNGNYNYPNNPFNLLDNLIAYWKLNETSGTRYDSHGNYDLIEYGSGEIESGGGVIGNSAIQNDLDEGVSLYITPSPYDSVSASWSLSFWMSTNDAMDDAIQMFPNAWGNCCIFTISTIDGDQILRGQIWKDGQAGGDDGTDISKSGIYTGGFVHVVVTHDFPTKTVRVYYNGVEEHVVTYITSLNSVAGGGGSSGGENSLLSMFAGDVDGLSYPGPGKLDEIGIWERVLEANEILALYNNGDGITYEDF